MTSAFTPSVPFAGSAHLLISTSAASDSSLEFKDYADDRFSSYLLVYNAAVCSLDSSDLALRTSSDNGVSFDGEASDYEQLGWYDYVSNGALTGDADSARANISLSGRSSVGNDTGESISGVAFIYNPSDSSVWTMLYSATSFVSNAGDLSWSEFASARREAGAVDAFEVFFTSGSIASGEFMLYGYF